VKNLSRENRILNGPPTQADYERVVDEAATLRMRKVLAYGEERYLGTEGEAFDLMMTFSDVYRKYIRVREAVVACKYTMDDGESLRDALLDLSNYALMGVQICDKYNLGEQATPAHYPAAQDASTRAPLPLQKAVKSSSNRIDQIAIRSNDPEETKKLLELIFETAIEEPLAWHRDRVDASGTVYGEGTCNSAELNFNYQLCVGGLEFEVLAYEGFDNWLDAASQHPNCFSHVGVHTEDINAWKRRMDQLGFEIAQEVVTQGHTNPAIKDSRRYHYVIFDTLSKLGFFLKLIQRLPYEGFDYRLVDGEALLVTEG